jgi:hypothetical protein
MKLVLSLVARDEEDILRENFLYHLNQGVDFILATDNGSVDGTKDIIHDFVKQGVAQYFHEPEYSHSQSKWMTAMSEVARQRHNADMIINSDADEFWWPKEGNLKSTLTKVPKDISVLLVRRNDFAPVNSEGDNLSIFERMVRRDPTGLNGIGRRLPPKVIHRAISGITITAGNHDAMLTTEPLKKSRCKEIEILHFPIRTYSQFETKIEQGGLALNTYHKETITPTRLWCILYDKLKAGNLHEYYKSRAEVETVLDYRLRNFMRQHQII